MKYFFRKGIAFRLGAIFILFCFISCLAPAGEKQERYGEVTATLAELLTLTEAMEWAYIDIGGFVSIENLNDLLMTNPVHDFDNIDQFDGAWVIDLATGMFYPEKKDLTHLPLLWQGPYVTYQESRIAVDGAGYDKGTLLDYWGEPYYLFSPAGLVRTDEHIITQEIYGDHFDLYAIVSLGPDGIMSSDDLYRTFGTPPTRLVLTSITRESAHPGDTVSIRGYNFGIFSKLDPVLYLNEKPVNTIVSWSDRLIEFTVPPDGESGNLKIVKDSVQSNSIYLTILEIPTTAQMWTLYE
ncbi:IPT/TIG domain-containing protein [Candidatus Sumerlaeota bacterium]|nr:IPT/TIG domain-containing protein [Candidatus Sumerlaeota bacterium]